MKIRSKKSANFRFGWKNICNLAWNDISMVQCTKCIIVNSYKCSSLSGAMKMYLNQTSGRQTNEWRKNDSRIKCNLRTHQSLEYCVRSSHAVPLPFRIRKSVWTVTEGVLQATDCCLVQLVKYGRYCRPTWCCRCFPDQPSCPIERSIWTVCEPRRKLPQ